MKTPKVGIFIQARSNSTRFPQKIYRGLPEEGDTTVLEHIYQRLAPLSASLPPVVLAPENDRLLHEWCQQHNIPCFQGPEEDVRERYRRAACFYEVDVVIRATADNPCVDREVAEDTLSALLYSQADLFSFTNLPLGVAVEAMQTSALLADERTATREDREHVSLHIKQCPELFHSFHLPHPVMLSFADSATPRLTIDRMEDLEVIRSIFRELGKDFHIGEVMKLFLDRPELFHTNRHLSQRNSWPALAGKR